MGHLNKNQSFKQAIKNRGMFNNLDYFFLYKKNFKIFFYKLKYLYLNKAGFPAVD